MSEPTPPPAEDPVEAVLGECLLRLPEEGEAAVERACEEHPELAAEIRAGVEYLRQAGLLGAAVAGDAPPERLGSYRLLRRLGGGGMGVVFLAEDETLGRRVALKVVRPDALFFEGSRTRFRREAEAVARLEHPAIVSLYTFGEENGVPFFAMEYVEGASLADVLRELAGRQPESLHGRDLAAALARAMDRPEPERGAELPALFDGSWWEASCRIALEVARAIEHAHQRSILHRDLKPSNLMLTPDGRVRVVDFGLARTDGATLELTVSGTPLGSLAYMSPEQLEGNRAAFGPPTDVYGLGVTLHELLALRSPFRAGAAEETRRRIREGRPRALRADYTTVPRDVAVVCAKAIDPDPPQRYPSAAALARDLGNLLARKPIEARPQGWAVRARRFAQRQPALAALLGVLALGLPVVAGLGGFVVARLPDLREAADRERRAEALALLEQGYLEAQMGKAERAVGTYEQALARWGDLPAAFALLMDRHIPGNDLQAAQACLERYADLIGRYPALRWFEVDLRRAQGRAAEADALAAELPAPGTGIDWYVEGLRRLDRYYQGDESVLPAVQEAFQNAVLNADQAQCLFHLKLAEVATYVRDEALVLGVSDAIAALWPESPTALAFAGLALWEVDDERGEALIRRAMELDPGFSLGWAFLAESRLGAEDFEGALEAVQRALELDPETRLAYMILGLAYDGLDRLEEAEAALRTQVEREPKMGQVRLELGRVLEREGREDEALESYRAGAEVEPLNPLPWQYLADLHARRDEPDEALAALRRAVELAAGGDPDLRVELAGQLAQLGAVEEARAELAAVLDGDPEHAGARALLEALGG